MIDAKKIGKSLFGGSFVLLFTINIFNALNYLFKFSMVRMLTISDYGTLAALISIINTFNISAESIQTIIAKYTLQEKEPGKIKNILRRYWKSSLRIATPLFIFYLVISGIIGWILGIEIASVAAAGFAIFALFLIPVTRGVLQGTKRFSALGINMIFEGLLKVGLAVLFVSLGWRVFGAVTSVFLGILIAFFLSFLSMRDILNAREEKASTQKIKGYSLSVIYVMFAVIVFYNLDVILAKAFFSDMLAGQYALASDLAKIIFFGTVPISKAMFPISSERAGKGEATKKVLINSLVLLSLCVSAALLIFGLFPEQIVKIFSGEYHVLASSVLFYLAVAMSLLSFTNLILLYKLSLGKIKNYWSVLIFLILEAVMLTIFRYDLIQYSITLIFLNMLFLFASILFFNSR